MAAASRVPPVVIPAAGLGTRLTDVTGGGPKELVRLGGEPVLLAPLLEAAAAGARDVVIVTSPTKPAIREATSELLGTNPALTSLEVAFVDQPEPRGVYDAVARATALLQTERVAVVFPDFVHLPDQTGLTRLLIAAADLPPEATVYSIHRRTRERVARMGGSARVDGDFSGAVGAIDSVASGPAPAHPWHTGLVELRGTTFAPRAAGRSDGSVLDLLRELAAHGELFGVPLVGELLDVGIPDGFVDATERFGREEAQWRTPTSS